jgi:iron complex outermembrane recepter protein
VLSYANSLPLGTVDTACAQTFSQKSDAPTWMLGLDYKPIDDVLLYGKYSRGYRQGSTNAFGANGFETFRPEQVDTYEIGAKTSWRGAIRGNFNIAGFYNDFTDQQVQVGFRSSTNAVAPNTGIVNAGKSRIYGVEVETTISPYEGVTLSGSYAYLNTKLKELDPVVIPPGSLYDSIIPTSVAGRPLIYTPKNKLSVTAAYQLPLPESIGDLTASMTYTYTGGMYASFQTSAGRLPSVELVNANLNWDNIGGRPVDAALFVTNLFDEKSFYAVNDQTTSGFVARFYSEPRMYGVRLRVRFEP